MDGKEAGRLLLNDQHRGGGHQRDHGLSIGGDVRRVVPNGRLSMRNMTSAAKLYAGSTRWSRRSTGEGSSSDGLIGLITGALGT
jgi:hypothetical protein